MSRRIEDLHPVVGELCRMFLDACEAKGHKLKVTQTYRTTEEQNALYAQGRTAPGKIVTNAPAGYSWHEMGRAFDVCFVGTDGQPSWAEGHPWEEIGDIGEDLGLEWGGRWKHADRPHFEHHGGMTLKQARESGWKPVP